MVGAVRSLARLAAACAVVVTVGLGPATAWASSGPPPPASCFQADSTGNYPTCTLVHGAWIRGTISAPDNPTATRIAIGGGIAVALLVLWAAVRAGRSRRVATAAMVPAQAGVIDLDEAPLVLPELLNVPD
jgi:hypothetical protein